MLDNIADLPKRPKIIEVPLHIDDRGIVYGAFDKMDISGIKRTYVVENHQSGFIRAWHAHKQAETYIHVISGVAKIAAVNIENLSDYFIATISCSKPSLFYIPKGFMNGWMSLVSNTKILVYSTATMDECKTDDFRFKKENIHPEIWEAVYR